jgi:hypothetical protein
MGWPYMLSPRIPRILGRVRPAGQAGAASYFVVSAEEDSVVQTNAPTSQQIETAFAAALAVVTSAIAAGPNALGFTGINPLANTNASVAWVGPQTRIVRYFVSGALAANVTKATNVVSITASDPATAQQIAQILSSQLDAQLANIGSWQPSTVAPYTQAINGDLGWWQCTGTAAAQCAAVTQTRDAFPELAARFQANENPVGPTSAATGPLTIAQGISDVAQAVGNGISGIGQGITGTTGAIATAAGWVVVAAIAVTGGFLIVKYAGKKEPTPRSRRTITVTHE